MSSVAPTQEQSVLKALEKEKIRIVSNTSISTEERAVQIEKIEEAIRKVGESIGKTINKTKKTQQATANAFPNYITAAIEARNAAIRARAAPAPASPVLAKAKEKQRVSTIPNNWNPTYTSYAKKGNPVSGNFLTSSSAVQSGVAPVAAVTKQVVKPVVKPVAAAVAKQVVKPVAAVASSITAPNTKPTKIPEHWMKDNPLRNHFWKSLSAEEKNALIVAPIAAKSAASAVLPQDSKSQMLMQEWLKKNFNANESKIIRVTKDPTGIFHTDILVRGIDMQKDVIRHGESRLFHVELEGNTYHIRLINVSSALPSGLMNASNNSTSKLTNRSDINHVIESLKRIATLINRIPKRNKTGILEETNVANAQSILTSIKAELDIALPFAVTIKSASNNTHNINKVMEDIAKFTALTDALEKLIQQSELAALEAKKSQFKANILARGPKIRGNNT